MSCCVECLCLAYVIPIALNEYRHCLWNDFVTFPNIRAFTYTFPCNFSKRGDKLEIYGTGGTMLQNTKNLLRVLTCWCNKTFDVFLSQWLPGLHYLELTDLQLEAFDGE